MNDRFKGQIEKTLKPICVTFEQANEGEYIITHPDERFEDSQKISR